MVDAVLAVTESMDNLTSLKIKYRMIKSRLEVEPKV